MEMVRLFGSYAKGTARPDSDLDLAITVGSSRALTPEGNYVFLAERWETALRRFLPGLLVKIHCYNVPVEGNTVRAFCDEFSKVLYQRKAPDDEDQSLSTLRSSASFAILLAMHRA